MTKTELVDKYWHQFLLWCATMPEASENELIFWLDHNKPNEDYFWEWLVRYRKEVLGEDK